MAQLICRDLCLGYDGREIVRDLNFAVSPGDYIAVLGENGATSEAIRDNYPGLVALMIVCMNVVTLPFAFLGFVSGKKKRESDRASMHGGK